MNRRRFLRGSAGLAAGVGLAGCSILGSTAPPPRKAKVFDSVDLQGTTLTVALRSDVVVESRREESQGDVVAAGFLGGLSPVGVARAAKGAGNRGAGGYSSAPKGRHGWAVWHGSNDDDDWRENHSDELRMYDATVATLGLAYVGSDNAYENDPPGPGPVPWDQRVNDPEQGAQMQVGLGELAGGTPREGWYRVGTELVSADGSMNFGWQAADFEVDNEGRWIVDKAWHVKPRV